MAMIRFTAFSPRDLETVKAYEAAQAANPEAIPPAVAEAYKVLVQENFGKLMSTMIGEIARFFDIAIKRKHDWQGYYGWTFSYHNDYQCWFGLSYKAATFLKTAFAIKWDDAHKDSLDRMIADEGYRKAVFGRDGSEWVVKEFDDPGIFAIAGDQEQMDTFSKVAEEQLDLLEI
jgi:hypothetical protein